VQILSDLLISRGIDPVALDKQKRCEVCRSNGPRLHENYACSEGVCRGLWGDLADLHWAKAGGRRKKDIKEVFRDVRGTLLDKTLGRKQP